MSRASDYDAWCESDLGAAVHAIGSAVVAQLAAPLPGERALEVGCGTGIHAAALLARGLQVTGVDSDPVMLAAAHRRAEHARLLQADATALPFAAEEFDLALAVTVFCFLGRGERVQAAAELVRVVRPGGRVVIADLARFSLWAAQRRLRGWRGSTSWRPARFLTAGELRELLQGRAPARSALGIACICRPGRYRRLYIGQQASSGSGDVLKL